MDWSIASMGDFSRVHQILKAYGPTEPGAEWILPRHFRRGRLTETVATMAVLGKEIEPEWWGRSSGEDEDDLVQHEEIRPYYESVLKFLAENRVTVVDYQFEVSLPELGVVGHPDWHLYYVDPATGVSDEWIWDFKCGKPKPPDSPYDLYCRYQLALYKLGFLREYKRHPKLANFHVWPGGYRILRRMNPQDQDEAITMVSYMNLKKKWEGR